MRLPPKSTNCGKLFLLRLFRNNIWLLVNGPVPALPLSFTSLITKFTTAVRVMFTCVAWVLNHLLSGIAHKYQNILKCLPMHREAFLFVANSNGFTNFRKQILTYEKSRQHNILCHFPERRGSKQTAYKSHCPVC